VQLDRLRVQLAGMLKLVVWGDWGDWVGRRRSEPIQAGQEKQPRSAPPRRPHSMNRSQPPYDKPTHPPCRALLPSSLSLLASSMVACRSFGCVCVRPRGVRHEHQLIDALCIAMHAQRMMGDPPAPCRLPQSCQVCLPRPPPPPHLRTWDAMVAASSCRRDVAPRLARRRLCACVCLWGLVWVSLCWVGRTCKQSDGEAHTHTSPSLLIVAGRVILSGTGESHGAQIPRTQRARKQRRAALPKPKPTPDRSIRSTSVSNQGAHTWPPFRKQIAPSASDAMVWGLGPDTRHTQRVSVAATHHHTDRASDERALAWRASQYPGTYLAWSQGQGGSEHLQTLDPS